MVSGNLGSNITDSIEYAKFVEDFRSALVVVYGDSQFYLLTKNAFHVYGESEIYEVKLAHEVDSTMDLDKLLLEKVKEYKESLKA